MSVKVMAKVFDLDIKPTQKLVLLSLADHADNDGHCYPSVARLAKRTGLSERAVQANLRAAQADGYLQVTPNAGPAGCNRYTVTPAGNAPPPPAADAPPQELHPRSKCTTPPQELHPKHHRTIIIEKDMSKDISKKTDQDPLFDRFWNLYPRKVGKGGAIKAWRAAVKKIDPLVIIEGLEIHRPEMVEKPAQYIPHPATWLNEERWADELEQHGDPFWDTFTWENAK